MLQQPPLISDEVNQASGLESTRFPALKPRFRNEATLLYDDNLEQTSNDCHVLVVHHRYEILNILTEMFHKFGYRVTTACDSAKALLYFGRKPSHLFFTDLDMPVLDGYKMARLIKANRPQTKVVAMTCRCQAELVDLMKDNTIDGWLFKPFNLDTFGDTLVHIGLKPSYLQPSIQPR